MLRASFDGTHLEYRVRGAGEPVLFIHGGLCAAWFDDLLDRPELSAVHRLIGYHRAGYAGAPASTARSASVRRPHTDGCCCDT
jgi:pimeloyl-ACP methyl ester carboxylesterase